MNDKQTSKIRVDVVSFEDRWWQVGAFGPSGCAIGWWGKDRWRPATPPNVKYISKFRSAGAAEKAATLGRECLPQVEVKQ